MSSSLIELEAQYLGERAGCRWPEPDGLAFTIIAEAKVDAPESFTSAVATSPIGFDDFTTNKHGRITIKGKVDAPSDDADRHAFLLIPQVRYRFYGRWQEYKNRRSNETEQQFHFRTFTLAEQHDRASVVRYLESAGAGYGFGAASAGVLFDKFGPAAVKVLRTDPETAFAALQAAGRSRTTLDKLKTVAALLERNAAIEDTRLELDSLLSGKGFPRDLPKDLIRAFGNQAAAVVKQDPFTLIVKKFYGCGFKKVDALYMSLGLPPDALKRQMFSAVHAIQKDRSGSAWFPIQFAEQAIKENVGGAAIDPGRALKLGVRAGYLSQVHTSSANGSPLPHGHADARITWVADGRRQAAEILIAEKIAQLAMVSPQWPAINGVEGVTDHQAAALAAATRGTVCSFIGGPGTGKSFCTAAYIKTCIAAFGIENVAVAAPTNKAAVRLTSALRERDIDIAAVSEHRLLGVDSVQGSQWEFKHNEHRPLRYKVIFLDESSMRSSAMLASILRACSPGTHLMFVGDLMQLPPIEAGAPFRDMLASKVLPFGELTEPQRNAGDMVFACDDIRRGVQFRQSDAIDWKCSPPKNFKFVRAESPEQQIEKLLSVVRMAEAEGFDPVWECQVMVAVNRQGKVARLPLNELLQRELNSSGTGPKGAIYLTGDKVVCEQNGLYKFVTNIPDQANGQAVNETFIAKGEFGKVVMSEPNKVAVRFEGRDTPVIVLVNNQKAVVKTDDENSTSIEETQEGGEEEASGRLSLAYAATVHKMQGSEAKIGIPIVDDSTAARGICTKEWFFTAISRGKTLTLPIGKVETAHGFCKRSSLVGRKTFLRERIVQAVNKRKLERML